MNPASLRRRTRGLGLTLGTAIAALALAACGGDSGTEDTPTPSGGNGGATPTSTSTRVPAANLTPATLMLNWTPNAHHAGIYLAMANGWYEEAGIDLEIVEPAAAGADQVVGAGSAEFGISQAESLLPAREAGIPVVSVATILPHNDSSFMALEASGITRPRDFEGKTYGGFGGALESELLRQLVACDGGNPDLVEMVEVGNVDYLAGMEQGRFDFVWIFEGWDALRAREVEGRQVRTVQFVDWLDCIPDWYTPIFITSEDLLSDRPELVRAFLEATARGYEAAIEDAEAAADALLAAAPELDETLVRAATEYHAPQFVGEGPWGSQDQEIWSAFGAFLLEAGLLESEVDTDEAFTNEFIAGAP